ncbi:PREDICTED: uncharacterized protein LOC106805568 isoform X3 [Priapulus caudatus]|uniref:Uncharacterized protein LOC106805568 isoform X3 n=1 Tax=Priapulus caudatus TaxID=37621 RepID=A0ABM1DRY6_PRICU|nr:PREDICTED: uncharacterized protein LOC106805568 isoform X3 [Priapulus caudatus]
MALNTRFCLVCRCKLSSMVESIPKSKKNKRCALHSLDTHKTRCPTSSWIDVWEMMSQDCREEVVLIDSKCLLDTMESYLGKHRFCAECRSKVLRAYSLLVGEVDSTKEKGYCAALYDGLRCCAQDRHVHVLGNTEFIDNLISRAEPELLGRYSGRERHAKTIDIAQEEVLTCVGIYLYERLHRIYQRVRAEDQTWQLLFYLGVDCLRKSYEIAIENKQGVSNLELLYNEIVQEEHLKEVRRELKRQKKKQRRRNNRALAAEADKESAEQADREDEEEEEEEEEEYEARRKGEESPLPSCKCNGSSLPKAKCSDATHRRLKLQASSTESSSCNVVRCSCSSAPPGGRENKAPPGCNESRRGCPGSAGAKACDGLAACAGKKVSATCQYTAKAPAACRGTKAAPFTWSGAKLGSHATAHGACTLPAKQHIGQPSHLAVNLGSAATRHMHACVLSPTSGEGASKMKQGQACACMSLCCGKLATLQEAGAAVKATATSAKGKKSKKRQDNVTGGAADGKTQKQMTDKKVAAGLVYGGGGGGGAISSNRSDYGYSSASSDAWGSPSSSRSGSDIVCNACASEGDDPCEHCSLEARSPASSPAGVTSKLPPFATPSLEDMLNCSCSSGEEDPLISEEEIRQYRVRERQLATERLQLRQRLKQQFAQLQQRSCAGGSTCTGSCKLRGGGCTGNCLPQRDVSVGGVAAGAGRMVLH